MDPMYAGEQRTIAIAVKMPDRTTPLPLAGTTLTLMIKKFRGLPDTAAIVKTSAGAPGGITITDAPNGLATATLDPADTVGLAGTYRVGLKIWPGSLEVAEDTIQILDPIVEGIVSP